MSDSLPKQKKLISISETAKVLGVSIDTVRRWDKSDILHSERPDGKNRYFSLDEVEKHKLSQPLSISETAKKLNLSATTLRRLEAKGLIKPNRNNAGDRLYDKESLNSFLNSAYFLRKKPVKAKVLEAFPEEAPDITLESEPQPLSVDLVKPHSAMPDFLVISAALFCLLATLGVGNIQLTAAKSTQTVSTPAVLSEIKVVEPEPTPEITPETESEATPAAVEATPEATAAAVEATPEATPAALEDTSPEATGGGTPEPVVGMPVMVTIEDDSPSINIFKEATVDSEIIEEAKSGDIFKFLSKDSDWYEVKLADGSSGFILAKFIFGEQ